MNLEEEKLLQIKRNDLTDLESAKNNVRNKSDWHIHR